MKNTMILRTVLLLTLGLTTLASLAQGQGGSNGGNGGDAMVCFKDSAVMRRVVKTLLENEKREPSLQEDPFTPAVMANVESVRLLDFYEAELPRMDGTKWFPVAIAPSADEFKAAHERLRQLGRRFGVYGPGLEHRIRFTIPSENFRTVPGGVVAIPDSDHHFIPPTGCAVIQIAIQYELNGQTTHGYYPMEFDAVATEVLIDSRLWERLSKRDQAGLIAHEYLYNFHRSFGESTSVRTRKINAAIFEEAFPASADQFSIFMRRLGYDFYSVGTANSAPYDWSATRWTEAWESFAGRQGSELIEAYRQYDSALDGDLIWKDLEVHHIYRTGTRIDRREKIGMATLKVPSGSFFLDKIRWVSTDYGNAVREIDGYSFAMRGGLSGIEIQFSDGEIKHTGTVEVESYHDPENGGYKLVIISGHGR